MSAVVISETEQLVGFLKNVKLFAELSTDSLLKLGSCLKTSEFPPAEVIVREGAPGVSMYIIKSGLVEVRKKDPTTGFDFLVAQLSAGAAVGEMSVLTGKPRSATVTTVQPTVVFTLTRANFRNLLTQHPEISLGLARILAERLEDATKQVGIEYVNLFKGKFDPRIVGLLPQSLCLLHKLVPIAYVNNAVTLANNILALAIKKGASDIHIEPHEDGVVLRLRIDGVLYVENKLSKKIQLPLASRFKILSRLDIAERRMPQDGRISIRIENRSIDFRVSTVPAKFGEKIVMRILDKSTNLMPLDQIIFHAPTVEKLRWMINQPYGIIYVTGPTGSGKTTTLYSSLNEINSPDINISTAEDPIEYDLPGLCQVQTHSDIGLDFARILRAFLRQDPDVILVGETRDQETAKIAVEAALTGHLVFTTLHTNDAPDSFTRLEEMGIEPFLMANSTIGIVAQRLARRVCQNCKVPTEVDETTLSYFGYRKDNAPPFYKGEGCDVCNDTGKKGRIGLYELLTMNDDLKRAVANGAKTDEIRDIARASGMRTLKEYAMLLMADGLTSVDEVLSNLVIGS